MLGEARSGEAKRGKGECAWPEQGQGKRREGEESVLDLRKVRVREGVRNQKGEGTETVPRLMPEFQK